MQHGVTENTVLCRNVWEVLLEFGKQGNLFMTEKSDIVWRDECHLQRVGLLSCGQAISIYPAVLALTSVGPWRRFPR